MADTIAPRRRSEIMSHIKSKDTSIELKVRQFLFSQGYRYRVNYKGLPGKPDIVFTKKKVTSKSNTGYWRPKIQRNQQRDLEHVKALEDAGWTVVVLWECQIKDHFSKTLKQLIVILEKTRGQSAFYI